MRMLKLGAPVRDFARPGLDGRIVWLGQHVRIGQEQPEQPRDVLLTFFATWCGPCCQELPLIAAYQMSHLDEVQVILVAMPTGDLEQALDQLLGPARNVIKVIVDEDESISSLFFGVEPQFFLPFSYYITKEGTVAVRMAGFSSGKNIERQLFDARQK